MGRPHDQEVRRRVERQTTPGPRPTFRAAGRMASREPCRPGPASHTFSRHDGGEAYLALEETDAMRFPLPQAILLTSLGLSLLLVVPTLQADEGMWLFNQLPLAHLKERYG